MCLTRRGAFCVRACVVCLVCQGFGSGTPSPRISVKCRSQEKASILLQNQWRRRALPALICGVLLEVKKFRKPSSGIFFSTGNFFFFPQAAAFPPERHLKFFHFSVSPKAWSRAEVDTPGSCFSTSDFH